MTQRDRGIPRVGSHYHRIFQLEHQQDHRDSLHCSEERIQVEDRLNLRQAIFGGGERAVRNTARIFLLGNCIRGYELFVCKYIVRYVVGFPNNRPSNKYHTSIRSGVENSAVSIDRDDCMCSNGAT